MSRIASWATAALVVLSTDIAPLVSAKAEPAALALDGTLRKIKETGAVTLAHREFSVPFSYYDDKQQPVGYAMDLCYRIAEAVKKELRLDKLEVKLNPVTSAMRIPLITNGTVDLECGSTTNTLERQKQVAFTIRLPPTDQQVPGADLNCSESRRGLGIAPATQQARNRS
jgi:glutamate/aspartate transport system substrate-binding protein